MISLTPKKLQNYLKDYDYEVSIEQTKDILQVLDDYYGVYSSQEIQEVTDYILYGNKSIFAKKFE